MLDAHPIPPSNDSAMPRRIALVHDWLVGLRGGELVLDRLAQLLHGRIVRLYTMFDDHRPLTPAIDQLPRYVSRLGRLPLASTHFRRWLLPFYPRAIEELSRQVDRDHQQQPFDLVLSTSSAAAKGVRPPHTNNQTNSPRIPHICYCHSPARYVWSQRENYQQGSPLRSLGLSLIADRFKKWDRDSATNVSTFIANSSHTRAEIRRCYGRDSLVVFPPVDTGFFCPAPDVKRENFWLVVSALEPYKRIDLAIEVANRARAPLIIVGSGSHRAHLEKQAGSTVRFLGKVSNAELRDLYRRARLLLFPQIEDFGIVAAEAQACGLPVIARNRGGALDIIRDGITGVWFGEATADSLLGAIERCPRNTDQACRLNAERFAVEWFDERITRILSPSRSAE